MIILEILYAAFCVWFAWYNAQLIIQNKRIYHGLNGVIHLTVAACAFYFIGLLAGLSVLLVARLFFDSALNYFRFGKLNYVPVNPESILDKLVKKITTNKELELLVEVLLLIFLNAIR